MNEADWTPSPHVERETASLRRRTRWGWLNVTLAGLSSIGAMAALIVLLDLIDHKAGPFRIALTVAGIAILGVLPFWLARRDDALLRAAALPDRARREEFGAGEGWLVDLTILQGAAPTGVDRGMLWIEDGKLLFAGDRTSFALGAGDLDGRVRDEKPVRCLRRAALVPLRHRRPAGRLALTFDVVSGSTPEAVRHLRLWQERATHLEGQLPPTRVGPGAPSRGWLLLETASVTAYWLGFISLAGATAFAVGLGPGSAIFAGGIFSGWAVGWNHLFLRWRAWRDRGRVGRTQSAIQDQKSKIDPEGF